MRVRETNRSAGVAVHAGYGDRPSRAWIRSDNQCVLLKSLWGVIRSADIELSKGILADAERLETQINRERGDSNTRQDLKVRGIRFDAAHASIVMYVELLHANHDAAALTETQLCEAFYHAETHYGGQFGMVIMAVTPVELPAAGYDPLADSFYESVREAIDW